MLVYFALAMVLGVLISLQAGVNSALSGGIGSGVWAAVVSFAVGTALLLAYALVTQSLLPLKKLLAVPPYLLIGGALGAIYVLSVIILFPKIGAVNIVIFTVMGQMLFALVIDHFGWFNAPLSSVNWQKIAALAVMLLAVMWFQKSRA